MAYDKNTFDRSKLSKKYRRYLVRKSKVYVTGFLDELQGKAKDDRKWDCTPYQTGVNAARKIAQAEKELETIEHLGPLLNERKYTTKHIGYHWADKDGTSIEVATLDELAAKDALCACLDLIDKLTKHQVKACIDLKTAGFSVPSV